MREFLVKFALSIKMFEGHLVADFVQKDTFSKL